MAKEFKITRDRLKELEAERAEKEKLQSQLDLFQNEAEKAKEAAVDAAVDG